MKNNIVLHDHGDQIVTCSDCTKPLFILRQYVDFKDKDLNNYYQALCPYCQGRSFNIKINGIAYIGPYLKDDEQITIVDEAECDGSQTNLIIKVV